MCKSCEAKELFVGRNNLAHYITEAEHGKVAPEFPDFAPRIGASKATQQQCCDE